MIENLINYVKNDDYLIGIYKNSIYIFNYEKILDISDYQIKIKLKNKNIIFNGKNLIIEKFDSKELLIKGIVKGIDFHE